MKTHSMKQSLQKIKPNKLNLAFIIIIALHIVGSNYIYDSYSLDRISITIYLIFSVTMAIVFRASQFKQFNILLSFLFLLFMFAFLESFLSIHIDTAFEKLQQQYISATFLLYMFYYFTQRDTAYSLKNFLNLSLALTYIIFIAVLIDYSINLNTHNDYSITTSILKYFKNIRVLNHLQTIMIPTLILYMHIEKRRFANMAITAAIAINVLAVIYTGARGTAYAVEFALLLLLISSFKNTQLRINIYKAHAIFLATILIYILISSSAAGANSLHITDISSNGRLHIYTTTLPYLFDTNCFFNAIGFSSQDLAVTHFLHPHNILLYVFLGTGTAGMLLFIVYLLFVGRKILVQYLHQDEVTDRYLLTVLIAALTHSFVSGLYITPLTALLFIYFILIFTRRYDVSLFKVENIDRPIQILNILLAIIVVATNLFLLKENMDLKTHYEYKKHSEEKKVYHPGILLFSEKIYY